MVHIPEMKEYVQRQKEYRQRQNRKYEQGGKIVYYTKRNYRITNAIENTGSDFSPLIIFCRCPHINSNRLCSSLITWVPVIGSVDKIACSTGQQTNLKG